MKAFAHFVGFAIFVVVAAVIQILAFATGFVVVPLALLNSTVHGDTARPFTEFNTYRNWVLESLPSWAWLWDNEEDGARGDTRGWWDANCVLKDSSRPWSKYWWLAFRNPANNTKRLVLGVDIRNFVISKLAGDDKVRDDLSTRGWQILFAKPKGTGNWLQQIPRYMLYVVLKYPFSDKRALVIQIGNKIKLEHNIASYSDEVDYFKGISWEFNPFKDIS